MVDLEACELRCDPCVCLENPVTLVARHHGNSTTSDPDTWDCPNCEGIGTVWATTDWFCGEESLTGDFECTACDWDSFIYGITVHTSA